ncbi:MAG: glycerophosphodiester phosphodiesterase family protein [Pseudomonadales bacterium]
MSRIPFKPMALVCVFPGLFLPPAVSADAPDKLSNVDPRPIVIAHRGASGRRPEHTLSAYRLALVEGADFVELDLVLTRDGELIARHENALAVVALDDAGRPERDGGGRPRVLEATTDVAERAEFADRLTVKHVDGRPVAGWFSEDFTLAEIGTLRARERMPDVRPWNRLYDDSEGIPTLADAVALLNAWQAEGGGARGLYIELKHPTYFSHEGRFLDGTPIRMDLGARLLEGLTAAGFIDPDRLYIQCFEVAPLMMLRNELEVRGIPIPLIQLFGDVQNRGYRAAPRDMVWGAGTGETDVYGALAGLIDGGISADLTYADLATPEVLAFMAGHYAAGIGPPVASVLHLEAVPGGGNVTFGGEAEPFLGRARAAGLLVHPYTLRAEAPFLLRFRGRLLPVADLAGILLDAGVNGFFIDQPDEGRLAVGRFLGMATVRDAAAELERTGPL